MRKTVNHISAHKGEGQKPLVCLTAYTASIAKAFDEQCDLLLVGDSVAMVLYGEPSTLQADMEMMIRHGRAVQNATQNALVVVDMPFGSYQGSKETAFDNAARILKETGAAAVKMEGGSELAETVSYLTKRGVPVMGHVGLQPQSMNTMGGFKTQGRDEESAQKIFQDAKDVARAGAFAIVIEGVPETLAADITQAVACPTIGIGASGQCDGQILVGEDMLGMTGGSYPKFVKNYADLHKIIAEAAQTYAREVRARTFPEGINVYKAANAPIAPSQELPAVEEKLSLEPLPEPEPEKPKSLFPPVLRATRRY
jgi:3-methyl-2-oxobutanoate hydroxymethyltransferase